MTKEELKDKFKEVAGDLGEKAEELAADLEAKIKEEKAQYDTETRRTLRKFWGAACVASGLIGVWLGAWIF